MRVRLCARLMPFAVVCTVAAPASAAWQPVRNHTVFRAESALPVSAAVNSRGDTVVAGVLQSPFRPGVFVRSRSGFRGRWSPLVRLDSNAPSSRPVVAIAESGDGAAAWVSADSVFVARRIPNGRWGRTFRIGARHDPNFGIGAIQLAVARGGRITVVWQTALAGLQQPTRVIARTQPRRSAPWTGPAPVAVTSGSTLALGRNAVAALAEVDRAAVRVRRLEPGGAAWSTPIDVNANGATRPVLDYDAPRRPRAEVAVSGAGEVAVLWSSSVGGVIVARALSGRPFVETPPIDVATAASVRFVGTSTLVAISNNFGDPATVFASVQAGAAAAWTPRQFVAGGVRNSGSVNATILGTAIPRIWWNVHVGPGDEQSGIAEFIGDGWRNMPGAKLVARYGPAAIATSSANLILVVNSVVEGDGNWLTQSFGGVSPSRPAPRVRVSIVRRSRSALDATVSLSANAVVWVRLQRDGDPGLTYVAPRRLSAGQSHILISAPKGRFIVATAIACDAAFGCSEHSVQVSGV